MTAKEYLNQLPNMQLRINSLKKSIQLCQECATKTGTQFSDLPMVQGNGNKIADNIEKKLDFEDELLQLVNEFEKFRFCVICQINRIPDNRYVSLLINRYVNNMSWEEIAEIIGYNDIKYVRKILHGRALAEFEKITPLFSPFSPLYYPQK